MSDWTDIDMPTDEMILKLRASSRRDDQYTATRLESLTAERSELISLAIQVLGWTWADACVKTDSGLDIRRHEIPELLERVQHDIPELAKYIDSGSPALAAQEKNDERPS